MSISMISVRFPTQINTWKCVYFETPNNKIYKYRHIIHRDEM
jgi:hypothetical protein